MATTMRRGRTDVSVRSVVLSVMAVLCLVCSASAFNVDVRHVQRYNGSANSMFGFSVAMLKESPQSWVLVGAPEAQSSRQRSVKRGGVVFRCPVTLLYRHEGPCEEVPFDRTDGNNRNITNHELDNKSSQWFGATVTVAESGAAVMACAPRYVYYPSTRERRIEPVGTCWVARDRFQRSDEFSPCRTSEWGYHRKGYCQAGLGASISKDGQHLFIGAPGSLYWQGQAMTVDATIFMPFLPPESTRVNSSSGQIFSENIYKSPQVFQTKEGPTIDDDTYLGYSVAVGEFDGHGNTTVAVGRPRGSQLVGKVEIYTWNLALLEAISGDQLGSYFGYSICASDMDGDGYDDLVVGAPLYTEPNNENKYEMGRIYVFYQIDEFERNDTRDGTNSRSRFGLSVASLGDINKDGYGDLAVGAPYDHHDSSARGYGRGSVYIYLGSEKGIREQPSQIIYAKDVDAGLSTFGFSVSGGQDLDNNEYPDLVVGAYEGNAVAFFRSRPIVKVDAMVQFNISSKQLNLKNLNCFFDGAETICLTVTTCLESSGIGIDNWHDFNIQLILDSLKPRSPRMFFRESRPSNNKNITVRINRNRKYCRDFEIYIKPNVRDKLTALEAEMRYSLVSDRVGRFPRLAPVLDSVLPPIKKDTLNIAKNCGPDNICIPDLTMRVKPSVFQYLLGSGENFNITVLVDNRGEDAFESTYSLQLPKGLNYVNINRLDSNKDVTVQCSPPSPASNNTLLCDIGNPLPAKKHVEFKILMQPYYAENLRSTYSFQMRVNSTNPEKPSNRKDNVKLLEIPIRIQTDLTLSGGSKPSDVHWNSIDYSKNDNFVEESEIGPLVVHEHRIRNEGPADIVEADVVLVIPTSTFAGDNLLYILEQPETHGPITCQKVPEANYLKLKLDPRRTDERGIAGSVDHYVSKDGSSISSSSSSSSSFSNGQRVSTVHEQESRGSSSSSTHHLGRGQGSRLVGKDEDRVMRKEEHSSRGVGESDVGYSNREHSSHSFQNNSQSSWSVGSSSGDSGPVVHSSTNYSASWSENGGPVYHYENHTSGDNVHVSSGTYHNGQGSGSSGHYGAIGGSESRREQNVSSTQYSRTSETSQTGRGYTETSGGYRGSNAVHHGSTAGKNYEEEEEEEEEYDDDEFYEEEEEEDQHSNVGNQESTGSSRFNWGSQDSNGTARGGSLDSSRTNSGGSFTTSWGSQDNVRGSQDNVRGSQDTGNARRGSHDSSRTSSGGTSFTTSWGSQDNARGSQDNLRGYQDNVRGSQDNVRGYQDSVRGSQDNVRGYQDNVRVSQDNTGSSQDNRGGVQESSGRYHGNSGSYDSERRQGYNATRGGFQHYGTTWTSSGGTQHQSSGQGSQWSSSRNVGHDNVNEDRRYGYPGSADSARENVDESRRQEGAYGYSSHQSRVRTHHTEGDNTAGVTHYRAPSSTHHTSSSWSQSSSSSHSQNQNSRQGGYEGDSSVNQYYSNNWDSDQSQGQDNSGSDNYNSRSEGERKQGTTAYQGQGREEPRTGEGRGGTGHFYTSTVLFGEGNQDLGYAARGYGHPKDSLSSLASRPHSSAGPRTTTLDPDLADLGSRFNEEQNDEDHYDRRGRSSDAKLKVKKRYRRSISPSLEKLSECHATNCTKIHCTLGVLTKNQEVLVSLRMRVWVPTMKKLRDDRIIKTSTRMALQVTNLPYIRKPYEDILRDHEVFTDVILTDSPTVPDIVPLWVVVLSAVAGTLILLLLILLLYKCGFFKRNRPSDAAEKEPLNRNGHYSAGDEAL